MVIKKSQDGALIGASQEREATLAAELAGQKQHVLEVEEQNTALVSDNEQMNAERTKLEADIAALQDKKDTAEASLQAITTQYEQLIQDNEATQASLSEVRERLHEQLPQTPLGVEKFEISLAEELRVPELEEALRGAEKQRASLVLALDAAQAQNQDFGEAAARSIKEKSDLSAIVVGLEKRLSVLTIEKERLIQALVLSGNTIAENKVEMQTAIQAFDGISKELEQARAQTQVLQSALVDIQQQFNGNKQQLIEKDKQLQGLSQQLGEFGTKHQLMRDENQRLSQQIEDRKSQLDAMRQEHDRLNEAFSGLDQHNHRLQKDLHERNLRLEAPAPAQVPDESVRVLEDADRFMANIKPLQEIREEFAALLKKQMAWLNPAFQASAQQYATELNTRFKALAKDAEKLIPYLKRQAEQLEASLRDVPQGKARQLFEAYLQAVLVALDLQKQLVGNANRKGLLATIEQALAAKKDIQQLSGLYKVSYQDRRSSEKDTYLAAEALVSDGSLSDATSVEITNYKVVDRVSDDSFREHIISTTDNKQLGRFIEERTTGAPEHSEEPRVKMTVVSFPPASDNGARVIYAMAMVTQILAGLKTSPTAEKPLVLRGSNKEELAFLYTALKVVGEIAPHMKFNTDAIKVASTQFTAEVTAEEIKASSEACYNDNFNNCAQLGQLKTDIARLTSDKFGHHEDHQQVIARITLFNEKMKSTLNSIKEEGAADEDSSPHQKGPD